jgi:uncharacterized protein (TIGR00251 family)
LTSVVGGGGNGSGGNAGGNGNAGGSGGGGGCSVNGNAGGSGGSGGGGASDLGLFVRVRPGGVVFGVWVQPKAARDELVGVRDGDLWLRVTAPPIDGKANDACVRYLTDALGLPRGSLAMMGGQRARSKLIQVSGIEVGDLLAAVERALGQAAGRPAVPPGPA